MVFYFYPSIHSTTHKACRTLRANGIRNMVISNIYKTFIITSFKKLAVPAEALAKNIEVHGMVRLRSHKMRTMLDNLRFCYQIFLFAKQFTPAVARRSSLERRWWRRWESNPCPQSK